MSKDRGKVIISTGRRKTAVAKITLSRGSGKFIVNGKSLDKYFSGLPRFQISASIPLVLTNSLSQYNINVVVSGGGIMAQSEAIRHGLARALSSVSSGFKNLMKKKGFLTRDDRMVERKKPGLAKARKSFQWTKR